MEISFSNNKNPYNIDLLEVYFSLVYFSLVDFSLVDLSC